MRRNDLRTPFSLELVVSSLSYRYISSEEELRPAMYRKLVYLTSVICLSTFAALAQNQYKIKQTVNMNGQNITNTTYVRGPRKRTESGGVMGMSNGVVNIEQCDLKQTLQVNDQKKLYAVQPFAAGDAAVATTRPSPAKPTPAPTKRGGTVTYTNNITDTGERKPMFGITARHLKTSTTVESSPDACNPLNMSIQADGWYIDLPEFSCPTNISGGAQQYQAPQGGCQDRTLTRSTGGGKLGFPLTETRTMNMQGTSFTSITETVEFSKAVLEASLFDIPAGYQVAVNPQDLYSTPDYSSMMNQQDDSAGSSPGSSGARAPSGRATPPPPFSGTKIGVLVPNNRGDSVSTAELQSALVRGLSGGNVMAVPVSSEAEARAKNLDYILATDITKLKQSTAGKIGGLFGKVAGTPTSGAFDAQAEYRVTRLSDGKVTLKGNWGSKAQTEVNAAANELMDKEAAMVRDGLQNQ